MSVYLCRYTVFCGYLPYLYLCACVFGKDSQQAYKLKVRTSAEKVLKKCGKSANRCGKSARKCGKVRIRPLQPHHLGSLSDFFLQKYTEFHGMGDIQFCLCFSEIFSKGDWSQRGLGFYLNVSLLS